MDQQGYYRFPDVHGKSIVFISEDDLWQVSLDGGRAVRLTTVLSDVSNPKFSDDGKWIAFTGREEGSNEIYIVPSNGGSVRRMTFFGTSSYASRWKNGKLIFRSNFGQPFPGIFELYSLDIGSGEIKKLNYGEATEIAFSGMD
jgi:tricorn protease